jgi:hypothetical protein
MLSTPDRATFTCSATPSGVVHSSDIVARAVLHSTYQPGLLPPVCGKIKSTKPNTVALSSHNSSSVNHGRFTAHTLLPVSQSSSNVHESEVPTNAVGLTATAPKVNSSVMSSALLGPTNPSSLPLHKTDAGASTIGANKFTSNSSPSAKTNIVATTLLPPVNQKANKNTIAAEADDAKDIALNASTASNATPTPAIRKPFIISIYLSLIRDLVEPLPRLGSSRTEHPSMVRESGGPTPMHYWHRRPNIRKHSPTAGPILAEAEAEIQRCLPFPRRMFLTSGGRDCATERDRWCERPSRRVARTRPTYKASGHI